MKKRIIEIFRQIGRWFRYWFWKKPVSKPDPPKATQVIDQWLVVNYNGQRINLHKNEIKMFNAMPRKEKRAMARKFAGMEKRGDIKFIKINGKVTCVYNRDYDKRAEKKKAEQHGII